MWPRHHRPQSCPWVQFLQPNPTHQTTDPTQPSPLQSKNFGPTNQPNLRPINPIELHNKPSDTRKTILIYHSQWKFIRYYSFISIYHYQVIRYYFSSHNYISKLYFAFWLLLLVLILVLTLITIIKKQSTAYWYNTIKADLHVILISIFDD